MTKAITDLPSADDIDGSSDLLFIYDNSDAQLESINRNTFLNLSSAPAGLTDTQTLTNKTLTSPTISGPTLSGTLSGTYTIGGTPTFPSSVATLTGSQTLTNKTLTSPTINTPTITNPTITVDTIAEFSTGNGVSVDGVLLKDGFVGDGDVAPQSLVAGTGTSWAWQSFTPTWDDLTVGNSTQAHYYNQTGQTIQARGYLVVGSTGSVGLSIGFSLPATADSDYVAITSNRTPIGSAVFTDIGGPTYYAGEVSILETTGATSARVERLVDNGSNPILVSSISSSAPFTWATGDIISYSMTYEAA